MKRFTESIEGFDWSFFQVEIDVFGHSERLHLPILPPANEPNHITDNLMSQPASVVAVGPRSHVLPKTSHLSLLFGLGICFPASAHSSPSDGCLNRNKLGRTRHERVRDWVWIAYNTYTHTHPDV